MTKDSTAPKTDAGFLSLADIMAARRTIVVELPHDLGKTQVTFNPNKYTEATHSQVYADDNPMTGRDLLLALDARIGGPKSDLFTAETADALGMAIVMACSRAVLSDFFPTKPVAGGKDGETEPTGE